MLMATKSKPHPSPRCSNRWFLNCRKGKFLVLTVLERAQFFNFGFGVAVNVRGIDVRRRLVHLFPRSCEQETTMNLEPILRAQPSFLATTDLTNSMHRTPYLA